MTASRLPIGIHTFRDIRENGYRYVDKTPFIRRMLDEGRYYFLSRPRRFGKSLLLDTIAELFLGSEALFRGLAIHGHWDWSVRRPVVRISFDGGPYVERDAVREEVLDRLAALEDAHDVKRRRRSVSGRFGHLLSELHRATGRRPAVLVDEYDKPILDALADPETARANRDFLRGLYGTIKGSQQHVRFAMLTGVSKFSKVNLFSGLNNLRDITISPAYSSICGYAEADLDAVFAEEMRGVDREKVRRWYNGYSWRGDEAVYNPFDILLLLQEREFRHYWFESGTPTFLVDMLFRRRVTSLDLEDVVATDDLLSAFDVDHMATEALLFQAGYLTITGEEGAGEADPDGQSFHRLGYPNLEVRQSLTRSLLGRMTSNPSGAARHALRLTQLLAAGDVEGLRDLLHAAFAAIPYEWHARNDLASFEGCYASVCHAYLVSAGARVTVEDSGSRGRADISAHYAGRVYIFELKVVDGEPEGRALAQIRERGYADKYRALGEPIHLVGIEFSRETRNIIAFETDLAVGTALPIRPAPDLG